MSTQPGLWGGLAAPLLRHRGGVVQHVDPAAVDFLFQVPPALHDVHGRAASLVLQVDGCGPHRHDHVSLR